jgi:hypothetical protein
MRKRHRLGIECLEDRLAPALLTVNTLADGPANHADGALTLREAVETVTAGVTTGLSAGELAQIAGPLGNGDSIVFAAFLTASGPATISLTAGELTLAAPDFAIQGPGQNLLTIERSAAAPSPFRIFIVYQNVIASITDLTIARGLTPIDENGGGILNGGELIVQRVAFIGNIASGEGGESFLLHLHEQLGELRRRRRRERRQLHRNHRPLHVQPQFLRVGRRGLRRGLGAHHELDVLGEFDDDERRRHSQQRRAHRCQLHPDW